MLPNSTDCIGPRIWRFWTLFPSPKGIFNPKPVTLLYFLHTEEIEGTNLTAAQGLWWLLQMGNQVGNTQKCRAVGSPLQCSSPTDTAARLIGSTAWDKAIKPRRNSLCSSVFPSLLCSPLALPPDHAAVEVSFPAMEQFQLWCKRILHMATPFLKHPWVFLVCNQGLPYLSIASLSHPTQRWLEATYPNKFQLF